MKQDNNKPIAITQKPLEPYKLSPAEKESIAELRAQMNPLQAAMSAILNHIVKVNGLRRSDGLGWILSEDDTTLNPQQPPTMKAQ